ncbi:MAG: hypothetical protein QOC62_2070 [Mycobacterium sp.]|nr:hypothetical protein [Mycobacterium sp.]
MRSKTGCRGNPTSSGVNGLGGGSIRIQRATPHNHALRIIRQPAENGQHLSSVTSAGNNAPHCADDGRERPRAIRHAGQVARSNVLLNRGAQLRRQTLHAQTKRTRAGREAGPVVLEGGVIETDHDRHFYQAL